MAKNLVDLLWRDSAAETSSRRGPRARHSTDDVVTRAIDLADADGLAAVTIRALAQALGLTPMSIYTHVNSRADLLVLMADAVHGQRAPSGDADGWRARVRLVAAHNLALYRAHPWLLDVHDPRTALGPGTIAMYDRELRAFDGLGLDDVERDAALTFVREFTRSAAARLRDAAEAEDFAPIWADAAPRLASYLGDDYPLAQAVGRAAGEAMGGPSDADAAWEFGLARVIDGLAGLIETRDAAP